MSVPEQAFSFERIYAMVLRHTYLMRKSWPRLLELAYWPSMQMILWAFIAKFLATNSSWVAQAPGLLIGAVLLWDVLFRSQLGVALTFFEEMYSRNLGYLFVSPLRPHELVISKLVISFMRTAVGVGSAAILAIVLYRYSVFDMGLALLAFFANLMVMGWSIGLMVSGLVLRYGLGAENLAWAAIFAVAPVCGVYYPVASLPDWLQIVAYLMPASHVFEGMRAVLIEHVFKWDHFIQAVVLNVLYLTVGTATFLAAFRAARMKGLLLQIGE